MAEKLNRFARSNIFLLYFGIKFIN